MPESPLAIAFFYGALAAASLPLGALIGTWVRPSPRVTSSVMAFGAGALLAAVSFELVLPALDREHFTFLGTGLILGCVVFVGLNHMLNEYGAFLRKAATLGKYARRFRQRKVKATLEELAKVDIVRSLPPEEIQAVLPVISHYRYPAGEILLRQGEMGDALYIIETGQVSVLREEDGRTTTLAHLTAGETFGEGTLLTNNPRNASVVATEPVTLWKIHKDDFDRLVADSPALEQAANEMMAERNRRTELLLQADEWRDRAFHSLTPEARQPTSVDIQQVVRDARHRGAAGFAILLGSALDGAGESVVLGATTVGTAVSLPLLGAIFLSNLPESMSSAVTLRRQGLSRTVIVLIWTFLVLLAGVFAAGGYALLLGAPPARFSFIEAMAAGAMLAMIAQTMLPEAFEEGGGNFIALLTVAGFVAGILLVPLSGLG